MRKGARLAATIVTWIAPLQAFNTVNNTTQEIAVWGHNLTYGEKILPGATSNGWDYKGKIQSISLYVCICKAPCKGSVSSGFITCDSTPIGCSVSPHGQQIVNPTGNSNSPLSVSCS